MIGGSFGTQRWKLCVNGCGRYARFKPGLCDRCDGTLRRAILWDDRRRAASSVLALEHEARKDKAREVGRQGAAIMAARQPRYIEVEGVSYEVVWDGAMRCAPSVVCRSRP